MLEINPSLPSPPTGDCICEDNIKIPDLLYNVLAWTLSTQGENGIISEKRVETEGGLHAKILSFGQDIIYLASHGKVKAPKHVSLPFLVKSKTGSVEIITVLNKLGHGISYSQLEEIEKGIAEVQMKAVENGTLLPSNCQLNIFMTFAFDSNDLAEQTLSGKNITHCTNGIVFQRKEDSCQSSQIIDDNNIKPK